MTDRIGHYPLQVRVGEVERLAQQDLAFLPHTLDMIEAIGVAEGWHCVDLGSGPKGITDVLSKRVGSSGKVIGLDYDEQFVEIGASNAAPNTEFVVGDAFRPTLAAGEFDMTHARFLASTSGHPDLLVKEAARLLRPGGCAAFQEAVVGSLQCYPRHPAWDRLRELLYALMPETEGADPAAPRIYRLLRQAGFQDIQFRPVMVGVRAGDPWQEYVPETVESVREPLLERGLSDTLELDRVLAECRAHLDDPDTIWTSFTVLQIWGTKP